MRTIDYFFIILCIYSYLLDGVHSWCLKTSFSDSEKINSIDFSRDGSKIVTASDSDRVIVWDAHTLEQLHVFNVTVNVNSAKFSKDNTMIAIGAAQPNIIVISVPGYTIINNTINSGQTVVYQVDFNEGSNRLISCGQAFFTNMYQIAGTAFNINSNTGTLSNQNMCCRFAKNTNAVAIGNKVGGQFIATFNNGVGSGFNTPVISRSGGARIQTAVDWNDITDQAYYGGAADKKVNIVSKTGTLDNTLTFANQVYTVSVSQDGNYAAVGGKTGPLYIVNTVVKGSQTIQSTMTQSSPNDLTASAFSPDSQYLVTGNNQGVMFMYKRICSGCPSGTYTKASQCRSCNVDIPGCYLCKNSTMCYGCANGYFLYQNSTSNITCRLCYANITGCNQCANDSYCISCLQGYFLDSGATNKCKFCWDSMVGCLSCTAANTCNLCDYRYFLNGSNLCVTCTNITNCLSCNSSSFCLQCVQGYYENGSGGCTQCTANCSNCINATFCTQCDNGFSLSSGNCSLCSVKGCLSCNSTGYCFDCIQSMWENAGNCTYCTSPCLQCSTSGTVCQACLVGYYLSGTNCTSCTTITQGCVACKGSAPSDCLACATGYYLTSGNLCSQCTNLLTNCAQCNTTQCLTCRLGYYYDSGNNSCKICGIGCLTCASNSTCLSCQVGYYHNLSANNCTLCPIQCSSCENSTGCSSCNPMYYYNSTYKNCTKCIVPNCVTCKNDTTCLTCIQGYFIDSSGTLCRACSVNITNCLACYNQSYCKSCQLGYYLNSANSTCVECVSACSTCDSVDCFTCQLGYYLTTTSPKTCSVCPKQCAQCSTNTNCSKCVPGYYYDSVNDKCLSCDNIKTGCLLCNQTQCFSCKSQLGYFFNSTNNTCSLCINQISRCFLCQNATSCSLCEYGYVYNSTNNTCYSCFSLVPNCQHCQNSTGCQTCLKGFYVDVGGVCKSCSKGCSTCNDSSYCQICLRQYVLQANKSCTICQKHLIGCEMCKYNPTIQCYNCIIGYYLTGTTCTLCSTTMEGCSICSNSSICLSCVSGYYLYTSDNKCHTCTSNVTNCQLCKFNTTSNTTQCAECNEGYFLSASNSCNVCTDSGCLSCSDNVTCTRCQSGFYLQSGDCINCQNLFTGCRICNTTACLQCGSGYFLNATNNTCQACNQQGCQVCSQLNPLTKCLACNSHYYLNSSQSCQLCRSNISNCLQCANSTICQVCQSGYYVKADGQCALCSSKYDGCSLCTPSICLECQSGYLLNTTNLCQLCNQYMPGCSFCLSPSNCLSCQSGYYAQNNTCVRCSTITGCLQCLNSTACIFCDYGYYLQNNVCLTCSTAIQNCVACSSALICTACLGNYILAGGACSQLKGQSFPNYTDIKLITEYVSETQLKHTLLSVGKKIYQIDLNWTQESKLYLIDQNYNDVILTILRTQFGDKGYSLIFYTDNPLSSISNLNNLNSMPLMSMSSRNSSIGRLLADSFSFDNKFKTKIQMSEQGFNSLFPDVHHTGTFFMKYKLSNPQFYKSVVTKKKYYYEYFGFIVSVALVVLYFLKTFFFVPQSDDKGQIIPHILCYKMMGFIIYPLYGEYLNYCKGFTLLDMPWLNDYLSTLLTIDSDQSPDTYKLFFYNLNIPSTYLFAILMIIIFYILGYLVTGYILSDAKKFNNFKQYFYNVFISGLVISSFLALQGSYFNPVNSISVNSLFYILGISIFVTIVLHTAYRLYESVRDDDDNQKNKQTQSRLKIIPFHKPRIILKCMALSLAYANPLYIFMSLIFLDVCLLIIEYILKKNYKVSPKLWLINHILLDVGLCFLMVGPYSLISLYLASAIVLITICLDMYIMSNQINQRKQILKVKLHEKQLLKTMQQFQKQSLSARTKNHQIYFKNKVLDEIENENKQTQFNQSHTKLNNNNSTFYFEQNQDEIRQNMDKTPINQQIFEEKEESNQFENNHKQFTNTRKRTVKSHLRNRKKPQHQTNGWQLQAENGKQDTFVLGQFQ